MYLFNTIINTINECNDYIFKIVTSDLNNNNIIK